MPFRHACCLTVGWYYMLVTFFSLSLSVSIIHDKVHNIQWVSNFHFVFATFFSASHMRNIYFLCVLDSIAVSQSNVLLMISRQIWKFCCAVFCIVYLYVQYINLYIVSRAKSDFANPNGTSNRVAVMHTLGGGTLSSTPARVNSSEDRGQVKAPTKWSLHIWEFSLSCLFCFFPCLVLHLYLFCPFVHALITSLLLTKRSEPSKRSTAMKEKRRKYFLLHMMKFTFSFILGIIRAYIFFSFFSFLSIYLILFLFFFFNMKKIWERYVNHV